MKIEIELNEQEMIYLLSALHHGCLPELRNRFIDAWAKVDADAIPGLEIGVAMLKAGAGITFLPEAKENVDD